MRRPTQVWFTSLFVCLGVAWPATPGVTAEPQKVVPAGGQTAQADVRQGTPKNLKAGPDLGEILGEAASAVLRRRRAGRTWRLKKKVTSSDPHPIIGELSLVTDGDQGRRRRQLTWSSAPASSGCRSTWRSRPTSTRIVRVALPRRSAACTMA